MQHNIGDEFTQGYLVQYKPKKCAELSRNSTRINKTEQITLGSQRQRHKDKLEGIGACQARHD